MRTFITTAAVLGMLASCSLTAAQEFSFPAPQEEHKWLQQLAGEWTAEGEASMGPDQPPLKTTGAETVRSIGGMWVIGESTTEITGHKITGIMTLGYDPKKGKYVGTWVDSMTSYMWHYEGTVDDSGKVLTLNTRGPNPMSPGEHCNCKDVIEVKSKDHKVMTSSFEGEDGKWVTLMTVNFRRKK